jgi:ribulose-phosphate 3-epimerase
VAPSILSADLANLEAEMSRIPSADLVHVDVMDGQFVPNMTFGLPVVERLAEVSPFPLDTHLMIADPDRWATAYVDCGAASVTFHAEAVRAPVRLARELHKRGAKAGIAINPGTPVDFVKDILPFIDRLLVMSVEPGFGGQEFIDETPAKVAYARHLIEKLDREIDLEVDGGMSPVTVPLVAAAGATTVVAGSAIFGAEDPDQAIRRLHAAGR